MKLKEIILFLLIFSMVLQGLTLLRITQTSYGGDELEDSLFTAQEKVGAYVAGTIIVAVTAGVAVGIVSFRAGIPGDRAFAYGLLGGILTNTLMGSSTVLTNIYKTLPADAMTSYVIVIGIFFAVLVVLISWMYVEYIMGVKPE